MKNFGLILIAAALLMAFRPDLFQGLFSDENAGGVAVPAATPAKALREIVAPICKTTLSSGDSARLSAFYLALADVIERDETGIVKTSAEVRLINERSGRLCFEKTGIAGRYPKLAAEIDIVIGYGMGSHRIDGKWESVEISEKNRRGLVEALRAIAWACGSKDRM